METAERNASISGEVKTVEALILEGLESGEVTPLTKADFEEIKHRGLERLKHKSK